MTYTAPIRLEQGDEVRCPHCRLWHPVIAPHPEAYSLHDGHAVLGVGEGPVLRRITRHRQPASDAATDASSVITFARPSPEQEGAKTFRCGLFGVMLRPSQARPRNAGRATTGWPAFIHLGRSDV